MNYHSKFEMIALKLIIVMSIVLIGHGAIIGEVTEKPDILNQREGIPKAPVTHLRHRRGVAYLDGFCHDQPCAWGIYKHPNLEITNYLINVCKCPDEKYECVRRPADERNLSVYAWIFKCRHPDEATANDYILPDDAPQYASFHG